jgi:predicted alpha-1,2-mannosidase
VQWSPDTTTASGQSYQYSSTTVDGFSLTHYSGAGCTNGKDLPISATVGPADTPTAVTFSHDDEQATPGYYSVGLANQVRVELTATLRTGSGRFTFPATQQANLVVDGSRHSSSRTIVVDAANRRISGSVTNGDFCAARNRYTTYFTLEYDRPFTVTSNTGGKAVITFDARTNRVVQAKVSTSLVSEANAAANLTTENPGWNFDGVRAATAAAWNTRLNTIKVAGGTADQMEIFYSNLYQSMLHPNVATDVNGQYRGYDNQVHTANGYTQYANFSGWDVYRSQVQLLAMVAPAVASDWVRSLLANAAECGGALPKWSQYNSETNVMVGSPAIPAIASIAAFGATGFDTQVALQRMIQAATTADQMCNGRIVNRGVGAYDTRSYLSTEESGGWWQGGQTSVTQEFAIADFALAQFARDQLGDTATHDRYLARSRNWRNVFDDASGYVQPRRGDGTFTASGNDTTAGMVEGNSSQYTWMVPHDLNNVVAALGGSANAVQRLDRLFTRLNAGEREPYFYIGNEPNFSTPWAYLWARAPWRTQDVVERIRSESFTSAPGGSPGNIDLGATSAWYVLAALGIFPAVPGSDLLTLNGPTFPSATLTVGDGATIRIIAAGVSPTNRYVQSLTVDGTPSTKAWTRFGSIRNGATLAFTMGASPSTWGSAAVDTPPLYLPTSTKPVGDLARGVTATANATCASGQEANKAVDGVATTKWCGTTTGRQGWLQLDLGQARTIDRWIADHAGSGGDSTTLNTRDFRLQSGASANGPWVDRDTVTGNTANRTDRRLTPVTARYWRILVTDPTQVTTDSSVRLQTVNLYTSTGNIGDLAEGKQASASSSCNTTTEIPARAVDASATTKWCGFVTNGEAWLQIDLGRAMSVKRWVVRHAGYGGETAAWNTKDFALESSTSPTGPWTARDAVTGNTANSTDRTTTPTAARYWRLKVTAPTQTTDRAARIYAFELYS